MRTDSDDGWFVVSAFPVYTGGQNIVSVHGVWLLEESRYGDLRRRKVPLSEIPEADDS